MLPPLILNFLIGISLGFILEFLYRSYEAKKLILPKFIDCQIYGLTGILLVLLYYAQLSIFYEIILLFIIPTLLEFIIGFTYLKIKKISRWDYSLEKFNYKGIICLKFSIFWFIIATLYYFLVLPVILN